MVRINYSQIKWSMIDSINGVNKSSTRKRLTDKRRHVLRMCDMARSPLWRKIGIVVLALIFVRYFWLWMTDMPNGDVDIEFIGKNSVQQTFTPRSCVMKDGRCVPENMINAPTKGLHAKSNHFTLDGKPFRILSGSFHYFRTHPSQWRDRLIKMKAAGLNTVTTYIPWNLHEEKEGKHEFNGLWNIENFIKVVHEVGMKLIVRPGPYICSEWEFGGLPSWLLDSKDHKVRSSKDHRYLERVEKYFKELLPIFVPHQYSKGTGPIIAFQVENEFGHYAKDVEYMTYIRDLFIQAGFIELLFTSDNGNYIEKGFTPGTFAMVNFRDSIKRNVAALKKVQPDKAVMVAEFWVGWFDHWGEKHHTIDRTEVVKLVEDVLKTGASINFYMFVGGTNFGLWNGANYGTIPTITSYDYDAPISEAGDFTHKAAALRDLLIKMNLVSAKDLPDLPEPTPPKKYGSIKMTETMSYDKLADLVKTEWNRYISAAKSPMFMEYMNFGIGGNSGYGWMLYRTNVENGGTLSLTGTVHDRAQVLFNSKQVGLIEYDQGTVDSLKLPKDGAGTLDILVENMGRVNYGRGAGVQSLDIQNKGLNGILTLDKVALENWDFIPLEFDNNFYTKVLSNTYKWENFQIRGNYHYQPAVYRAHLDIDQEPVDTFLNMTAWTKGIVLVNGFNLGRYWNIGPQQTLYVPHPLLKRGSNEFVVFELHKPSNKLTFLDNPILDELHKGVPSLYPHEKDFYLDGRPFRIISGSFHYFRTQPAQWGDRIERMKAAGLNTITTYIPWNLHEKKKGEYQFSGHFDLASFIQHVHSSGLKMIVRPGPYICAEWDFGGLPSWLLHDPNMIVRESKYEPYLKAVEDYFSRLLPILSAYQYSKGNGPIVAFQVENEYGSYGKDDKYMKFIADLFGKYGIEELLFTSDGGNELNSGTLPGVFETVNFQKSVDNNLDKLQKHQPGKPMMVAEFWSGWFDHWGEHHHTMSTETFVNLVSAILRRGASINFYMFVGGTNFDFWNGANNMSGQSYAPTITSYDYDAPISESGHFTEKAHALRKVLEEFKLQPTDWPHIPEDPKKAAYGKVIMKETIPYDQFVLMITESKPTLKDPVPMEFLDINNGGGQGYGYIVYRTTIKNGGILRINGYVADRAQIFLEYKEIGTMDWISQKDRKKREFKIPTPRRPAFLDIFVENSGRVNYSREKGLNIQRKGIFGEVLLNNLKLENWVHIPVEFCEHYYKNIHQTGQWKPFIFDPKPEYVMPALYRGHFKINTYPRDTFLDISEWKKGIVFVNGHNLGRYWSTKGPQKTLYVPVPILIEGTNEVIIFEQYTPEVNHVKFVDKPVLG